MTTSHNAALAMVRRISILFPARMRSTHREEDMAGGRVGWRGVEGTVSRVRSSCRNERRRSDGVAARQNESVLS